MSRFVELTADDQASTKLLINVDQIIATVPDGFTGTSKIMVQGVTFAIKEDYETVKSLLLPH